MVDEIQQSINQLEDILNSSFFSEDKTTKRVKKYVQDMKKLHGKMYVGKLKDVRENEAEGKVITSVAIHGANQIFIEDLQAEAKEHFFTLSKENIVNLALLCLHEKYNSMSSVEDSVDSFY